MTNATNQRPDASEYAAYYAGYVSLVTESNILEVLRDQSDEVKAFFSDIPEERAGFRYSPEKWSIREAAGHVTDAERVFSFRAFTFARRDTVALPSFEQEGYVRHAFFDERPLAKIIAEFEALRSANILLLEHLNGEAWTCSGIVNGNPISVRALAYIMAGHVRHHLKVLKERYLQER